MTDKPKAYPTAKHFARARADIAARRTELIAKLDELVAELAEIDACESKGCEIAERYPEDAASPAPTAEKQWFTVKGGNISEDGMARHPKPSGVSEKVQKARPPNTGKPYSPEDLARLAAASHDDLKQMAHDMGRTYDGLVKQHELILKQRKPEKADTPAPGPIWTTDDIRELGDPDPRSRGTEVPQEPTVGIGSSSEPASEDSAIVEAAAAHETAASADAAVRDSEAARELAEFDSRRKRMPPAKPGIPVRGWTDNGPKDQRYLDPVAFASPRPGD